MKKTILILVLVFSFCGCSGAPKVHPEDVAKFYSGDFETKAAVTFGENKAEMKTVKNGMSISVFLEYPAELSGMEVEMSGEHVKVKYNGMEQELKKENLPKGTSFLLLEKLFTELASPENFTLSTENGNITAEGKDFFAVLSAEDLSLLSAKFEHYATEFLFSDWFFTDEK